MHLKIISIHNTHDLLSPEQFKFVLESCTDQRRYILLYLTIGLTSVCNRLLIRNEYGTDSSLNYFIATAMASLVNYGLVGVLINKSDPSWLVFQRLVPAFCCVHMAAYQMGLSVYKQMPFNQDFFYFSDKNKNISVFFAGEKLGTPISTVLFACIRLCVFPKLFNGDPFNENHVLSGQNSSHTYRINEWVFGDSISVAMTAVTTAVGASYFEFLFDTESPKWQKHISRIGGGLVGFIPVINAFKQTKRLSSNVYSDYGIQTHYNGISPWFKVVRGCFVVGLTLLLTYDIFEDKGRYSNELFGDLDPWSRFALLTLVLGVMTGIVDYGHKRLFN